MYISDAEIHFSYDGKVWCVCVCVCVCDVWCGVCVCVWCVCVCDVVCVCGIMCVCGVCVKHHTPPFPFSVVSWGAWSLHMTDCATPHELLTSEVIHCHIMITRQIQDW